MSYILDALKKSEEARRRSTVPDASVLITEAQLAPKQANYLPWIFALVVLNGAALGIWLWRSEPSAPATAMSEPPAAAAPATAVVAPQQAVLAVEPAATAPAVETPAAIRPAPQSARAPSQPSPEVAAPVTTASEAAAPAVTGEPATAERAATEASEAEPVSIEDLSDAQRARIPPLAFSTHIYASEAEFREVGINGIRYREGDVVAEGVVLVEITELGVVLREGGTAFSVSVFEDWTY